MERRTHINISRHHWVPPHQAVGIVCLMLLLLGAFGMPLSFSAETPGTRATPPGVLTTHPVERGVFEFKALTPIPASATTGKDLGVDRWLIAYQENAMLVFALEGRDRILTVDVHTSFADGHIVTTYDGMKSTT